MHYPSSQRAAWLLCPASSSTLNVPLPSTTSTTTPSVIANAVALQHIVKDNTETSDWREDDEMEGEIRGNSSDTSSHSDEANDRVLVHLSQLFLPLS